MYNYNIFISVHNNYYLIKIMILKWGIARDRLTTAMKLCIHHAGTSNG